MKNDMNQCSQCGNMVVSGARFCNRCGHSLFVQTGKVVQPDVQQAVSERNTELLPGSISDATGQTIVEAVTPLPLAPSPQFSEQDLALLEQGTEYNPAQVAFRGTVTEMPTVGLEALDAEEKDDKKQVLPILGVAAGIASLDRVQSPGVIEEIRVEHQQPVENRSEHQQPQDARSSHQKPEDPRGQHEMPQKGIEGGMQKSFASRASGTKAGIGGAKVALTAVGALTVTLIVVLLTAQFVANNNEGSGTPTPISEQGEARLSVLQANNVYPGGQVSMRGEDFLPGGTVTFTIKSPGATQASVVGPHGIMASSAFIQASQGVIPDTIVHDDGTFTITFVVPDDWEEGNRYTIEAYEELGNRTAEAEAVLIARERPTGQTTPTPTKTVAPTPTGTTGEIPPTPTQGPVQRDVTGSGEGSATQEASSQTTIAATSATGIVRVTNVYTQRSVLTIPTGTQINNQLSDISVILDATATFGYQQGSYVDVPAHIIPAGTIGNIPAYTSSSPSFNAESASGFIGYYNSCEKICIQIISLTAFSGGEDAYDLPVVTQVDIDQATSVAQTSAIDAATARIVSQLQTGEVLISEVNCNPVAVSPNRKAGEQAANVTVTVEVSCTATAST